MPYNLRNNLFYHFISVMVISDVIFSNSVITKYQIFLDAVINTIYTLSFTPYLFMLEVLILQLV